MASYTFPLLIVLLSATTLTYATTITVVNNCPYTVWAASSLITSSDGKQLNTGGTWQVNPPNGSKMARIWGRTKCTFDSNGNGPCETGGCGKLVCDVGNWGANPKTLFEYTLAQPSDTIDISLIEGFNIPLRLSPTSNIGSLDGKCKVIGCTADINGQCPANLKTTGGCNNPCTTNNMPCGPNTQSDFFKQRCPDAYSYPKDDQTSTFACPSGTNYKLTFCP